MSDPFADAVQPHCPDCRVVMRPTPGGDRCLECGRLAPYGDAARPEHDGPALPGY